MGIFGNGYANATAQAEKLAIAGSVTLPVLHERLRGAHPERRADQPGAVPQPQRDGRQHPHDVRGERRAARLRRRADQARREAGVDVDPKGSSKSPGGAGGSFAGLVLNQTTLSIVAPNVSIATGREGRHVRRGRGARDADRPCDRRRGGRQHVGQRRSHALRPDEQQPRSDRHRRAHHRRPARGLQRVVRGGDRRRRRHHDRSRRRHRRQHR